MTTPRSYSHPKRSLLIGDPRSRHDRGGPDGGDIPKYLEDDDDLNNIAMGVGLLLCPTKCELKFRPDTLAAHARRIYQRGTLQRVPSKQCAECIDPFLQACSNEPCIYTAVRDITWPRTAFLIGKNRVVTARHSIPIDLGILDDIRIIFGLTYDKLRKLTMDPYAKIDIDNIDPKEGVVVAKCRGDTYDEARTYKYDWATFDIEVVVPRPEPGKAPKDLEAPIALKDHWFTSRADGSRPWELAMVGHPLGLPLTCVRNTSTLTRVPPPDTGGSDTLPGRPDFILLAAMDSIDGYSGSPVLARDDGKWHIVGLCVGTAWHEKAGDKWVRACALSGGDVVDSGGKGRCRILPAESFNGK